MDFDRLDAILKEKRISRRKLALAVGIKEGTMSTAFMRRSGLSPDMVKRIAEYLGVTYDYLQGWDLQYDENNVAYLFRDGVMVDLPIDPDAPNYREELERRKETAIREWAEAENRRESDDIEAVTGIMRKMNIMGRFQVLTYAEDMVLISKYLKKDSEQGDSNGQG